MKKRPEYNRRLARSGQIDAVVATKMDRFFRDEYFFYATERKLSEYGVEMLSSDRTGNRIGDGAMISYAAWEKERISERLHGGIKDMVLKGEVKAGPKPPYGYRFDATGNMLEVFEPEMEAVRSMYASAAGGDSVEAIRGRLDDQGLPTPGRSEKSWNKTTTDSNA